MKFPNRTTSPPTSAFGPNQGDGGSFFSHHPSTGVKTTLNEATARCLFPLAGPGMPVTLLGWMPTMRSFRFVNFGRAKRRQNVVAIFSATMAASLEMIPEAKPGEHGQCRPQ